MKSDLTIRPALSACSSSYIFCLCNGSQCRQIVSCQRACLQTALMTLNVLHQQAAAFCQPNKITHFSLSVDAWHQAAHTAISTHTHTHARTHTHTHARTHTHTHARTHTHTFNGPLTRTTRVSWYQKGKTNLDFTAARDSEWQWHQLGHMQLCTSLQTDNHASTPALCFLQAGCPSCRPTNSVKALKVWCCQQHK